MDDAGIQDAVLLGLSMGGYVAFRILALAPERVSGLVLADTRAGADGKEGKARRTDQAIRVRGEGVGWLADAMIPALLGETTMEHRPRVKAGVRKMIQEANPEGVARALEAMRDRPDSKRILADIAVPTLVLVGEEDTLTPVEESEIISRRIPGAALEVIPAAGHLSNLEAPDAFNRALGAFLG
jgi:3-oxoadipate enol-lactonase